MRSVPDSSEGDSKDERAVRAEPCESCGTPVSVLELTLLDGSKRKLWVEGDLDQSWGMVTWEHSPARCRDLRKRQEEMPGRSSIPVPVHCEVWEESRAFAADQPVVMRYL